MTVNPVRRTFGSTIALAGLVACSDAAKVVVGTEPSAPATPAAVTVLMSEDAQAATVGRPFTFNLAQSRIRFSDPPGAGLTYRITLTPKATGLAVSGMEITGVPNAVSVITATVTATDVNQQSAEARFPIIAQRADLPEPRLPATPYAYADESAPLPPAIANSPQVVRIDNMTAANRVTDAGAALGRVLFYDRRLSVNDQVACASCHQQQFSFSDTARFSIGVSGAPTRRHSMPLTNVRFYGPARFFRDERAATLEDLALQPVFDASEMGLPPDVLVPKLRMARYYAPLYAAAFGDSAITADRTARALAQFVRALKTTNSKIDSLLAGTTTFSSQEVEGQILFEATGCRSCHESYAVVSDAARNNGLDATNLDHGAGQGRLKSPSLRNVVQRPPYMHDGRFRTLEAVIDFYDAGVQDNPDLDHRLRAPDGSPRRLHLASSQKLALVAFLHTLTDRAFLADPRFSNPFPH
ncbi:MAG: cytochrome-c peroxidase [Gemmatimonadaceae bacterium]|nr:cytochrome-c peroxidase [Gemmatimonadaceae bacterium]